VGAKTTIMDTAMIKTSPMMQQWHECKEEAKEALLLFRLGDFYEAFYDDAAILSSELELTLTKRQGVPMSGIPAVSLEGHLDRLVKKGFLVAIAEQVEKANETRGLVKREIVRTVSSATNITTNSISEKQNQFFGAIARINASYGLALIDLYTGEMIALEFENETQLKDELYKRAPKELLISKKFPCQTDAITRSKEDGYFDLKLATNTLCSHFGIHSLDSFGLTSMVSAIVAAGSLLRYISDDLGHSVSHIQKIQKETNSAYMGIDPTTAKHLEIEKLFEHLDFTSTPMGARLLRNWVFHPLVSEKGILHRQSAIDFFQSFPLKIERVRDLERLVMKIKTGHIFPRDLLSLSESIKQIPLIKKHLNQSTADILRNANSQLVDLSSIATKIDHAIVLDPPYRISEGNVFKPGFSEELDEIRSLRQNSQIWMANYQAKLQNELEIKTLKVSYTKAFGYYIEVSKGQTNKVPAEFERKQTLLGAERYTTFELKEYERKILHAENLILEIEERLFKQLIDEIALHAEDLQNIASSIAMIDAVCSLASAAKKYRWTKPEICSEDLLELKAARHPIVENMLSFGTFIPNDTLLSPSSRLLLITGPNMAGKSTYIRQVALIAILAQIGSFVPADHAKIKIIDKVFARIGASDDLSKGQSTFMVEMTETANILHSATAKSLVILDEIGRGTSTYDGISIAWAVAEYLLREGLSPKTLFATHYTELTELEKQHKTVRNFRVSVHESDEGIVFLHKIAPGGADKSYGIHVAKLAGLPKEVLFKAKLRLTELEALPQKKKSKEKQLTLFNDEHREDEILQALQAINLDELTPMQALLLIAEWKKRL